MRLHLPDPSDAPPDPDSGVAARPRLHRRMARGIGRVVLILVGCVAMTLAGVGLFLPLIPTTPFVLLAAPCFVVAWPAMHRRMAANRLFGQMIEPGPGGRYLPVRAKVGVVALTLVSIGATILLAVDALWLRVALAAIGLAVSAYLLSLPGAPRERPGG